MQHPDEGKIHTWLDGELASDEASSLEAHIADCPECSAKVAEARGLVAASSRILSALDVVPSGVIPSATPARRPWYAGTQLRAAAAVVIVAGASFLALRNRDDAATMERVMSAPSSPPAADAAASANPTERRRINASSEQSVAIPAPVPAAPRAKSGAARRVGEAESSASSPPSAPQANEAQALSGKVTGVEVEADFAAPKIDSAARRRMASVQADGLMGRGVAAGVGAGIELRANLLSLRKVRSDSTQASTRTVFEVSPGVEVILTEVAAAAPDSPMKQRAAITATAPRAASTAQRDEAKTTSVNIIRWTDGRGHLMTLAGPLVKEELEALRQRLPEDQR